MYYNDLFLSDFGTGIFQNAQMQDLADGMVVIGGPQRAGKTTFLQALRQIGYGVGEGGELPPPADKYRIRSNLDYDGDEYMLTLEGHGAPTVAPTAGGPERSVGDLFGGVSRKQYEQLFTITLDELKQLPDRVEDAEDLSQILLGAAYGDVAVIPDLESTFNDRAYDIGRAYGKPTKKSGLRAPMDAVEAGIEARDQALEQVDVWGQKQEEFSEVNEQITTIDEESEALELREERLTVLEDEFETIREYKALEEAIDPAELTVAQSLPEDGVDRAKRLRDEFEDAVETHTQHRERLAQTSPERVLPTYKRALLEHEESLKKYDRQVPRWEDNLEEVRERSQELQRKRDALERRVSKIHADWDDDFDRVVEIETGTLTADGVDTAANGYETATKTLEQARDERRQKQARLEELQNELENAKEDRESAGAGRSLLLQAATIGLLSLAIGVGGAVAGFLVPGVLGGIVLLLGGLYIAIESNDGDQAAVQPVREVKAQISTIEADLEALDSDVENAEEPRSEATSSLREIRNTLGLPEAVTPEGIQTFYQEVVSRKTEIQELRDEEAELANTREQLVSELQEAVPTVAEVGEFTWDADDPLRHAEALFETIEATESAIDCAQDVEAAETRVSALETEITDLLDEWENVGSLDAKASTSQFSTRLGKFLTEAQEATELLEKEARRQKLAETVTSKLQTGTTKAAFSAIKSADEDWVTVMESLADEYDDTQAVKAELATVTEDLEEKNETVEQRRDARADLNQTLAKLKSDDEIVEAREQINEGRQELRELGEEYAINRIAEDLTQRLHERFIQEVAGPLIDDASEIFHSITQEYEGIDHNDQFDDLDFEALRNGKSPHSTGELSRATAEQLFLAIRLARIRQIDVSLPVVMDDSMTNFDPAHGARTLQTMATFAETHQVFFLTCHPEHVRLAESYGDASQFWSLDNGRFSGPHDDSGPVHDLLKVAEAPEPQQNVR